MFYSTKTTPNSSYSSISPGNFLQSQIMPVFIHLTRCSSIPSVFPCKFSHGNHKIIFHFLEKKVVSCERPLVNLVTAENIHSFVVYNILFRVEFPVNIIVKDMVKMIAINLPIVNEGIFPAFM